MSRLVLPLRRRWGALPGNTRGLIWVALAMIAYTAMNMCLKQLGTELSELQSLFLRALAVLVLLAPLAVRRRGAGLRSRKPGLHLARVVLTAGAGLASTYAVNRLPLAQATVFSLTIPLMLIPLGLLFLREAVRPLRWLGVLTGFAGVWLIAQPQGGDFSPAMAVALVGAFIEALLGVALKKGAETETALAMIFWSYCGQLLLFGALGGATLPALSPLAWLLVVAMGGLSLLTGWLFVLGYRAGEASAVEPGSFSMLIFGALGGHWLFGEALDPMLWAGGAVLLAGLLLVAWEPRPARLCDAPR